MDLKEGYKIISIWGKHLEDINGKLTMVFSVSIPESFLPFPKNILEQAIDVVAENCHNKDDLETVNILESTKSYLNAYEDDEDALLKAAKRIQMKEWRKVMLPALKKTQKKSLTVKEL